MATLHRDLVEPNDPPALRRPVNKLGYLHRFPPGTSYPEIIAAVKDLLRSPPLSKPLLLADHTGVGRPVLRLLEDALRGSVECRYVPMVITAGHAPTLDGGLGLPRQELAAVLQVLLQTRRLAIPTSLPEARVLIEEMQNFQVRVTAVGSEPGNEPWRDGAHDDLVLAVGIAAWASETGLPVLRPNPPPPQRVFRLR